MKRNLQFAYAAGIMDGEGSFGISFNPKNNAYASVIQARMTNVRPLNRLKGLFGGSLNVLRTPENGNLVPYHYTAQGRSADLLLRSVLPFLIQKHQQAEMLLELRKSVHEWNERPRQRGNLPSDVHAYRRTLKERVQGLNASVTYKAPEDRRVSSDESLAYAAGVLEGEGNFQILRGPKNYFFSRVVVQMTCKAVLEELLRLFGGSVTFRARNGRPVFAWTVKGRKAADVCRAVFEYLTFKKEEADLLRQLQNTTDLYSRRFGPSGLPARVVEKRVQWMRRVQSLHHGIAVAETESEQPVNPVSDSPICIEPKDAAPAMAAAV